VSDVQAAEDTVPGPRIESAYARPPLLHGVRVLVERSLPLGPLTRIASPDIWVPAVAPSAALRRWYALREDRYEAFARRYEQELEEPGPLAGVRRLRVLAMGGPLILQTTTAPIHLSHATVLARCLRRHPSGTAATEGGDAVCWLNRVCPECGRLQESGAAATCPYCHTAMTG
jgi:uncharacterized protein YeaO (DUF488 family)